MSELTEEQRELLEVLAEGDARTLRSGGGEKTVTPAECRELRRLWIKRSQQGKVSQKEIAEIVGVTQRGVGYHLRGECQHWDGDVEAELERLGLEMANDNDDGESD